MPGDPRALHWFEDCPNRTPDSSDADLAVTIDETTCLQCIEDLGKRGMLPGVSTDDPPW